MIFEASFRHEQLFIRTDILVKRGERVQLIEVKAKSFDPEDEYLLKGKKGGLVSSWKPYLFNVAFQRHVIQQCHPQWKIQAFLMLADKRREAQVEGTQSAIPHKSHCGKPHWDQQDRQQPSELCSSVLGRIRVHELLDEMRPGKNAFYTHMSLNSSASYSGCKSYER